MSARLEGAVALVTGGAGPRAIEMRGTVNDPVEEIPILAVGDGVFAELNTTARCRVAATVPAEDLLPYH